ncbi:TPA: abortive infection system antitoxin AbiGi family protein, partial [Vibrio parahaemolyticus]
KNEESMKPKSDSLFHFTRSLDVLKSILRNGIFPRYCMEDIEWMGGNNDYVAYPMSCFCDIPLSRISEHTSFYGRFGLGLSKEWGRKNNLNPVIYSSEDGLTQKSLKFFMQHDFDEECSDEAHNNLYKLLALHKPVEGKMVLGNEVVTKEFHLENEWRYIPDWEIKFLFTQNSREELEEENKKLEKRKLEIAPSDIKYIFVPEDGDIPKLVDFINNELGSFSLNDLKILQTRIVSLATLNGDI